MRRSKREAWGRIIRAQEASGLTIAAWCHENGIVESTFYYYKKELRRAPEEPQLSLTSSRFSPVVVSAEQAGPTPSYCSQPAALTLRYKAVELDVTEGTSSDLLLRVLDVVAHAEL